jgi:Skp family chaperone for outer membrane proteins
MEARLTETFGAAGEVNLENLIRQHNDRLSEVSSKFREELAEQQQSYLTQIKDCREEIRSLKSALRHEQQRSRRLQALLRGDP